MSRILILLFILLSYHYSIGQDCLTFTNSTVLGNDGNGNCTFEVTILVDADDNSPGDIELTEDGEIVAVVNRVQCQFGCDVTFTIIRPCDYIANVEGGIYKKNGSAICTGETGEFPLPVTWYSIDVFKNNQFNIINWSTSLEIDNNRFDVEFSSDGIHFSRIGAVLSEESTSVNGLRDYSFRHLSNVTGLNYYRIRQIDHSGASTYSLIVSIKNDYFLSSAYPNPFSNELFVGNRTERWELRDVLGRSILQGRSQVINTSSVKPGIYYMNLYIGDMVNTIRLIKN